MGAIASREKLISLRHNYAKCPEARIFTVLAIPAPGTSAHATLNDSDHYFTGPRQFRKTDSVPQKLSCVLFLSFAGLSRRCRTSRAAIVAVENICRACISEKLQPFAKT